jgi:hypothetical protein
MAAPTQPFARLPLPPTQDNMGFPVNNTVCGPNQHHYPLPIQEVNIPPVHVDTVSLSTMNTNTKKKKQGIRYETVKGFIIEAQSLEDAADVFKSLYGCKITKLPVDLTKASKLLRHPTTKQPMQIFNCSCNTKSLIVSSKVRLVDTNEHPFTSRQFKVEVPKTVFGTIDQHFFKLVNVNFLPNLIQNKVVEIFQGDPTATIWEALHEILVSNDPPNDGTQLSIAQWIANELFVKGNNIFPLLIQLITEQSAVAIQNMERNLHDDPAQFQHSHGPSVQSAIQYLHHFSFTKFTRVGLDRPTFQNFQHFMDFYQF